jgi:hypothetical protein
MCCHFVYGADILNLLNGETILLSLGYFGVIELMLMGRAGHVESVRKTMKPYRMLVGKPEGKKETTKGMCDNNIKIDLKETDVRRGLDLRASGQGKVACFTAAINRRVPQDAKYFLQELRTSLHQEAFCSVAYPEIFSGGFARNFFGGGRGFNKFS